MIEMFNINNYVIDTSNFDHALYSSHVKNSENTVSIPFNETLTSTDVKTIIDTAKKTGLILSE
jgi:hypothetical protein